MTIMNLDVLYIMINFISISSSQPIEIKFKITPLLIKKIVELIKKIVELIKKIVYYTEYDMCTIDKVP